MVPERTLIGSEPVRIELDDSLLKKFNQLSEDELKGAFGSFTPVQSLNPYMTKLSLCSISEERFSLGNFSTANSSLLSNDSFNRSTKYKAHNRGRSHYKNK